MEKIITSSANIYVKHLKKLQTSAKYRTEQNAFLLEGERPVTDALGYGVKPKAILVSEKYKGNLNRENLAGVEIIRITDKVAEYISDTKTPQGIMAEFERVKWNSENVAAEKSPFLLFCDRVSDPGNMGTIIRSLECAGASGIILGNGCVDIYNPKTVRSTMSALFNLPVYYAKDNAGVLKALKKKGYKIIGTRMEDATTYTEEDFTSPCIVVVGNEANGISEEVMACCDGFVKIPLCGKTESLNVAVASAVIAYEVLRQNTNK